MIDDGLNDHERALMQLVREGGDQASWYWLGKRVGPRGLPLQPDMMVVLRSLKTRGLLTSRALGDGNDRWTLTPLGAAVLDGALPPGPLPAAALLALVGGLRGDLMAAMQATNGYRSDGLRLWASLRQAVAVDPDTAMNAATVSMALPDTERGGFLRELAADPRPPVRAAVFAGFSPPRTEAAGDAPVPLPVAERAELLRAGLLDQDRDVRTAAAKLAFGTGRGAGLVGELIAQLDAPEAELRWWSVLALGNASDPVSVEVLRDVLAGADETMATVAARALAARADGRPLWLAALHDQRAAVADAAIFALGRVATGVADAVLTELATDPRAFVREALVAYLRRNPPASPPVG